MSDSPASRPKRNSSFASFYIDEDDFEDGPSGIIGSRKSAKEDVFVMSEKCDVYLSENSSETEFEAFEPKTDTKSGPKSTKRQTVPKKTNIAKVKPKSISAAKLAAKDVKKPKKSEDDDNFEIVVVEDEFEDDCGASKTEESENTDENFASVSLKTKKSSSNKSSKSLTTFPSKPPIILNRPKLPSAIEKVRIPGHNSGPRRVGLSRSAPTRPLSPVKLKKNG